MFLALRHTGNPSCSGEELVWVLYFFRELVEAKLPPSWFLVETKEWIEFHHVQITPTKLNVSTALAAAWKGQELRREGHKVTRQLISVANAINLAALKLSQNGYNYLFDLFTTFAYMDLEEEERCRKNSQQLEKLSS